jgi:hypothetical protein
MADEIRVTDQSHLDALITEKLRCAGCGKNLHPVYHRNIIQWTCPVPGCSRMLPNLSVEGRILGILMDAGVDGRSHIQKVIARYKKSLLGKK